LIRAFLQREAAASVRSFLGNVQREMEPT